VKPAGLLLLGLLLFSGCRAAHNVAVTSFRVLDAPANYVRKKINGNSETTTTTVSSDAVTTPGRTVTPSTASTQRTTTTQNIKPSPSPKSSPATVTEKSKPSPSPSRTTTTQSLPTAKPVPGKPGYVFSPFDPSGGYVDVTGYASGQKVKDPYSGKIFLVP
jgi:hypothetical protein